MNINTFTEEASLEFRLRKIDETGNYLFDEINHNDLISKISEKIRGLRKEDIRKVFNFTYLSI